MLEAGGQLAGEVAVCFAPEEAQDVGALEVEHRVPDEGRIEGRERGGVAEQDVGGLLGLIDGLVVALRPRLEGLGMQRVEPASDLVERSRPFEGELLVSELLR